MATIRPFQPEDIDQCAALYVRVFGEPPWNEVWRIEDARRHLQQAIDTPGFEGLVAVDGARVVGVVTGNRKCTAAGEALLLDDMYVDGGARGQGLGKQMMDELKRRLAGRVSAFALFTQRDSRAAEFYRKYGFLEDSNLRFMLLGIEEHPEA
jgi:aminoglycoside 6'-N-acetyltransferase I